MSTATIILCDACSIGLPLVIVVWLLQHRREYVAKVDLTHRANVIAKGVVEGDTVPVTIDYEQRRWIRSGTSVGRKDAKAVYRWDETNRTITGKPFILRTADLRIQVDPDEDDVSLLWEPDHAGPKRRLDFERVRRASLEPGTTVEIFGRFTPAPSGGGPYREGAALPTLVPSRVERLLISKQPIAPKFVAMRRYLTMRAVATVAIAGVAHVALHPVWEADLVQLGIAAPSESVRAWIGVVLALAAYYLMRIRRPWNLGRCNQYQVITK